VGKLLAQKGARVIKVESPSKPDRAKTLGPFYDELNGLKEIIQLEIAPECAKNPAHASDRARFEELVRQAHGLIEAYRPATKAKLGLDAATLHKINPKLCIVSLTGYPEDGPWRDRPGHDMNFQALTGCLSLFNELPGLPLADLFGAHEGALALTAAMDATARGAPGSRVVVSLSEALKDIQSSAVAIYQATGEAPKPGKTLFSGQFPCYRLYTAGCGRRVTVGAIEPKFWEQVCQILGVPELIQTGYATGTEGDKTVAQLQKALGSKPWSHWAPLFEKAQCCVEPVLEYPEVFGK
jgi:crotonobetainyl-CoA:carnitine CoA-transferase CaiB-like acyl-CoA transferase